jgi:uncharacterized damage-inducible protein DinB
MAKKKHPAKRARKKAATRRAAPRARAAHTSLDDKALRKHVISLLADENAHVGFERAVADFPLELCGLKPDGVPYSAWQILEHLRIAQWDILEFSRNPRHISPKWPEGYWPPADLPSNQTDWQKSIEAFRADLKAMERLVSDPRTDLFAKIPHGDGQTILREALLVADHNAYHIGQLVILRRLLGAWSAD